VSIFFRPQMSCPVPMLDDVHVRLIQPLLPPACLMESLPLETADMDFVVAERDAIAAALDGRDDRLVVLVGPDCVHDRHGAMAFATMLLKAREELASDLIVVMEVDFETPRKATSAAWKGLIHDPDLAGKAQINKGLTTARELLLSITRLRVPISMEYLDTIVPQFVGDLVSVGMFSGRTSESQVHRELASGLSSPVGFANGTDGSIQQAVDACNASMRPHAFLSVTKQGLAAIVHTNGNSSSFVMLAGSQQGPNYATQHVETTLKLMEKAGVWPAVGIDCAHNADDDLQEQCRIVTEVAGMIAAGSPVRVVLMESYLQGGAQEIKTGRKPSGSLSVTSPCLDWATTEERLAELAQAVRARRMLAGGAPPPKKPKLDDAP